MTSATTSRSFRDPDGYVVVTETTVYRVVRAHAVERFERSLCLPSVVSAQADQLIMPTHRLPSDEPCPEELAVAGVGQLHGAVTYAQARVLFPSYPSEWCAPMLHAAAMLTMKLARQVLADAHELKDAHPNNVLFIGTRPVFVDLGSFFPRRATSSWLAYGQFCRSFVAPLAVARATGIPPGRWFKQDQFGLTLAESYTLLPWRHRLSRPVIMTIAAPVLLERWFGSRAGKASGTTGRPVDQEQADFIFASMLRGAERSIAALEPPPPNDTKWVRYAKHGPHEQSYHEAKVDWCSSVFARLRPRRVLDLGANTGALSEEAARAGSEVVAIDSDHDAVATIWRRASAARLPILPLVIDILDPTPARGWVNGETASFVDRSAARFDMVVAAAILHWIVIVGRVPIDAAIDLFARCTIRWMIIEWIPFSDPQITSFGDWGEDADSRWVREAFDRAIARHFRVIESALMSGSGREMLLLERV